MPHALPNLRPALHRAARFARASVDDLFPPVLATELRAAADDGFTLDTPDRYCHRCGASAGPGAATARGCSHCIDRRIAWESITRLGAYRPTLVDWIGAMKFARQWQWAPWFGHRLADAVRQSTPGLVNVTPAATLFDAAGHASTIVCPVPMHWIRRWKRGFNQADLIARSFARATRLPCARLLRRTRHRPPQSLIVASQRRENVAGSMGIEPVDLSGWDVWLVDDVKTSGATLEACIRLLRKHGAGRVNVAVAAVADPKDGDFKIA